MKANSKSRTPSIRYGVGTFALLATLGLGMTALPLGNVAFAKSDGDHGHSGDHGSGTDAGHGNSGAAHGKDAGNSGGNGSGSDDAAGDDNGGTTPGSDDANAAAGMTSNDDGSLSPSGLGKLNGFFHASPNALVNASPNSSIGRLSHTFKDALDAFAAVNTLTTDPNATPPSGPTTDDLGGILAGATNKTVTGSQVKAIIEHLAESNPDDTALGGLAASVDAATCRDIADAANGQASSDDTSSTDTSSDGSGDTGFLELR